MRSRCAALLALCASAQTAPVVVPILHTTIVITAAPVEPSFDRRNAEVFGQTLFSRDDQVFHQLNAGINAGQHEGGGKSIEVRRFGFNLDHGGVNGGLKVLVDNVQQNQTTQGHGQGYLGSLKSVTPELIAEASIINGPFSAEYGDFSGLGVVHIRLRESLPDEWTARLQGGSFQTSRGFLAYSPDAKNVDSYFAYEGSRTDGPFLKPLNYRRDNVSGNLNRRLSERRSAALKYSAGRNIYSSSGQIPLGEVDAGRLDRFGSLDSRQGGHVRSGTLAGYLRQEGARGSVWKLDGFMSRSLFDMDSNFTYFLNDSERGDAISQHDSRLQQGANLQYQRPAKRSLFTAGGNFHSNQIDVGQSPQLGRVHANVTSSAGYAQQAVTLLDGRMRLTAGVRHDLFHFRVGGVAKPAGSLQPKLSLAYTPWQRLPLTVHANYGRGISSMDARGILRQPNGRKLANTDFYQAGTSHELGRVSLTTDLFWIDRSNELVYVADDGTLEFLGPTRAYGFEAKASLQLTSRLALSGGLTKVGNAYYRGTAPRAYVDRAPHLTANAALTLSSWRGWTGSLRMRAINHYLLDGAGDLSVSGAGHTVFDLSLVRRLRRGVELNFALDNVTGRAYWETQNYIESRPYRNGRAAWGIHGTPGYPLTATAGLTLRFRGK